jgi:hypothetical protein
MLSDEDSEDSVHTNKSGLSQASSEGKDDYHALLLAQRCDHLHY